MRRTARLLAAVVATGLLASCGDGGGGWSVEVVRDDLDGPTQVVLGPDGVTVFVAELHGGEDDGTGRVLDLGDLGVATEPIVVADGLLTPTGVAVLGDGTVVVQEQRRVTAAGTVLHEPPTSNGRSHGTVTVLPDGDLLVTATGRGSGPDVVEGSGALLRLPRLDVGGFGRAVPLALGFKNAYAHALTPDGDLLVTEIGDGRYDGDSPADELNLVPLDGDAPYDGGWPRCTGDAVPTDAFGATAAECAALPRPVATFAPRATPTSVAVTSEGRVLVALWVEGRVVEVDLATGELTDVATDLDGPQHLLAIDDGSVLLTVHRSGQLLRLRP